MMVKQIVDENFAPIWDKFVAENSFPASFLQSWQWGEFKDKTQNAINDTQDNLRRYAVYESEELVAVAQFLKVGLPGGKFYLNCQRGPIFKTQNSDNKTQNAINPPTGEAGKIQEILDLLIKEIQKIAKEEKIVFVRIAPPYSYNFQFPISNFQTNFKFQIPKILTHLMEPTNTLLLDLSKSEEELLAEMHQKTRYNIKLAEKKGVKIRINLPAGEAGNQESRIKDEDIDTFYELMKETAKRDKINIFSKEYYKSLVEFFCCHSGLLDPGLRRDDKINDALFIAEHKDKILAAIFVVCFGDSATYLYGASSNESRELMPNYLLQWSAIKWAKEKGYKNYDFWGITRMNLPASPKASLGGRMKANKFANDNWAGITRFKMGFAGERGGKIINYSGVYDIVLNKFWYNLYRLVKILPFRK